MRSEDDLKELVKKLPKNMSHGDFVRLERVYRSGSTRISLGVKRVIAKAEPRAEKDSAAILRRYYSKNEDIGDEEWDARMLLGYWCYRYHEMYDGDPTLEGVRDILNEVDARAKALTSSKLRRGIDAVMTATTEDWWSGGAPTLDLVLNPARWTKFVAPRLNKKPKKKPGEQAEWSGTATKAYVSKRVI